MQISIWGSQLMLPTISKRPFSSSHLALRPAVLSVNVGFPRWSVTLVPKPLGHSEGVWNALRGESYNLSQYLVDGSSGDGRIQCIDHPTLTKLMSLGYVKKLFAFRR